VFEASDEDNLLLFFPLPVVDVVGDVVVEDVGYTAVCTPTLVEAVVIPCGLLVNCTTVTPTDPVAAVVTAAVGCMVGTAVGIVPTLAQQTLN
jgi:hypothetical protein